MYRARKDFDFVDVDGQVVYVPKNSKITDEYIEKIGKDIVENLILDGYIEKVEENNQENALFSQKDVAVIKEIPKEMVDIHKINTQQIKMMQETETTQEAPNWKIPKQEEIDNLLIGISFSDKEEIRKIITNIIINTYSIIYSNENLYLYNEKEGIYEKIEEDAIKKIIEYICEKIEYLITETGRNEIINAIKAKRYIPNIETNEEIKEYVPLKNCYYSIKEKKFHQYTPAKIFLSKINTEYNENAPTPTTFLQFLEDITEKNEQKKEMILDMMAYCLYRANPHEQMFLLVGSGSNGKSTLLKLLEDILGKENIASRPLHDLAENRFATADLEGKFANIVYELKSQDIREFDKIKALVSGDTITAERKFQQSFQFRNFAKLIFATNVVPAILDESDAVYRRMVMIEFTACFEKEKKDVKMLEKLLKEKEGILKMLIERLDKVIENGVRYETDVEKIRDRYKSYATSWEKFIDEYVEENSVTECVFAKDFYEAYLDFCKENQIATKATRHRVIKELAKIQKEIGNSWFRKKKVRSKEIDTVRYNPLEYMLFGIRLTGKYETYNKRTEIYEAI